LIITSFEGADKLLLLTRKDRYTDFFQNTNFTKNCKNIESTFHTRMEN